MLHLLLYPDPYPPQPNLSIQACCLMVLTWLPEHHISHLNSRQEVEEGWNMRAAVIAFSLKKKSEKQELSQKLPSRFQPECVTGPPLATKEASTVASKVEKGKGKGDW